MRDVKRMRVVVGFPADAAPGRQKLGEAVYSEHIDVLKSQARLDIEIVAWDTHSGPGIHEHGAQGWIDLSLDIEDCDVFVAIFFQRLGTAYAKGSPPTTYRSGTAYELETAISAWQRKGCPQVWLCFPNKFVDEDGVPCKPCMELSEYIDSVKEKQGEYGLYYLEYSSWNDLGAKFGRHLFREAIKALNIEKLGYPAAPIDLFLTAASRVVPVPVEALAAPAGEIELSIVACSERQVDIHWQGKIIVYVNTAVSGSIVAGLCSAALTVFHTQAGTGKRVPIASTRGRLVGVNAISFDVSIDLSANVVATVVISDVMVNANQLGVSLSGPTQVVAFVAAVGFDASRFRLRTGNLQVVVASVCPALTAVQARAPRCTSVQCKSDFVQHEVEIDVVAFSSPFWNDLLGRFTSDLMGSTLGERYSGLRILFRMHGFADRSELFVEAEVQSTSYGHVWRNISADVNGAGWSVPAQADQDAFPKTSLNACLIQGQSANVVYELTRSRRQSPQSLPLKSTFKFNVLQPRTQNWTEIRFNCSLAPLSTVTSASATAPIPRFADTSFPRCIVLDIRILRD